MALLRFFSIYHMLFVLASFVLATGNVQSGTSSSRGKILIILTSADVMGHTGIPTGWFLSELAHPYKAFVEAGFEMDSVSPKGGKAPVDQRSVEAYENDTVCQWFQANDEAQALVNNTKIASQINPSDYVAVFYPGGHGPMFDLATDMAIANITEQVFAAGGVVGAVCHGPAGLLPVKVTNGDPLVKGRGVTGISNAEEDAVNLSFAMPFPLETRLRDQGGIYSSAGLWQEHVVTDGRLVTGQNPDSAGGVAVSMIALLN